MMNPGMGAHGWGMMRSLRQDRKVTQHKLPKGTVKRVSTFARPYTAALSVFLVLIVIDAVVGAVNPLLARSMINHITQVAAGKAAQNSAVRAVNDLNDADGIACGRTNGMESL